MPRRQEPTRIEILNRIFECFQQATQWHGTDASCEKYLHMAESLIEILEIVDCGATGGFDEDNPKKWHTGFNLYDRFITVANKHGNAKDIKKCCHFTLITMGEYYTQLKELRGSFRK